MHERSRSPLSNRASTGLLQMNVIFDLASCLVCMRSQRWRGHGEAKGWLCVAPKSVELLHVRGTVMCEAGPRSCAHRLAHFSINGINLPGRIDSLLESRFILSPRATRPIDLEKHFHATRFRDTFPNECHTYSLDPSKSKLNTIYNIFLPHWFRINEDNVFPVFSELKTVPSG